MEQKKEMESMIGELFGSLGEKKTISTPVFAPTKPTEHEHHYAK